MATPYYPAILAEVQAQFPTSQGYSTTFQTQFATFLDTYVVPLVDPTKPIEEQDINLVNAFKTGSPGNYALATGALKIKMYTVAEFTLNLVKDNNTGSSGSSKIFFGYITQVGPFEPTFDSTPDLVNDTDEIPIWLYTSPGIYTLTWGTTNPMPNKYKVKMEVTDLPVNDNGSVIQAQLRRNNSAQVELHVGYVNQTLAAGPIFNTLADSLISGVGVYIEIFS